MEDNQLSPHPFEGLHEAERGALELGLCIAAQCQHEPEHRHEVERVGGHDRSRDRLVATWPQRAKY